MDELEFYNGIWTGQQIDDAIGRTGFAKLLQDTDNLNSVSDNGFYYWTNAPMNAPEAGFGYAYMIVIRRSDAYFKEIVFRGDNQIVVRQCVNNVWGDWNWVSGMPMTADVEYETAERFNGKVVYCKALSVGSISANATSTNVFVSGLAQHGTIIRHSVFGQVNATNWVGMPYDDGSTIIKVNPYFYSNGSTWGARVAIKPNVALTNVTAMLWYTKD